MSNELQHQVNELSKQVKYLSDKLDTLQLCPIVVCSEEIKPEDNEDIAYVKTEKLAREKFKLFKHILHTEMKKIRKQWTKFDYAVSCEYNCGLYTVNYQMFEQDNRKDTSHCISLQLNLDPDMIKEGNIEYMEEIAQQLGKMACNFCYLNRCKGIYYLQDCPEGWTREEWGFSDN